MLLVESLDRQIERNGQLADQRINDAEVVAQVKTAKHN